MTDMEKPAPDVPWYKRPGGILFIHFLRTVGLGFIAGPLAASFALFFEQVAVTLPLAFLAGIAFGALCAFGGRLPPAAGGRYLLPLGFSWVMIPAFFPFILVVGFSSALFSALRFLPAAYVMGLFMGYVFCERRRKDKVRFPADCWVLFGLLLALPAGCIVYGVYQDKVHAARRGHGFERVGGFSSTDLKPYDPRVPGAITPRLAEPSSFMVRGADKLPVLDGAEAAFPVYAAFAAACYPDLPRLSEEELRRYDYRKPDQGALTFTNTIYAFQRLIEGEVDIFFGAQPSENQKQLAADKGKELVLTPIAKEAFVFFVNEANPLDDLGSEQIRAIYSGKVRNWREFGGGNAEIIAFQRPEDSGSQTIMRRFMGDTPLEPPLQDRYVGGMGGVVKETSQYRNAPSAIGYSFRFFLTGLGRQPRIKMLAVDGVMPAPETIRSGEYPYVVNLYAVTIKDNPNPAVAPFLEWMRGEQGQELIEKTGYVRLK